MQCSLAHQKAQWLREKGRVTTAVHEYAMSYRTKKERWRKRNKNGEEGSIITSVSRKDRWIPSTETSVLGEGKRVVFAYREVRGLILTHQCTSKTLARLYTTSDYPVLLLFFEAHNFIPCHARARKKKEQK